MCQDVHLVDHLHHKPPGGLLRIQTRETVISGSGSWKSLFLSASHMSFTQTSEPSIGS